MSTRTARRRVATVLLTTALLVSAAVASAAPPPEGVDPAYGGDGLATIGGTRGNYFHLYANASALAPGNKLVVAGRRIVGTGYSDTIEKVAVARFLASGAPDLDFGDKGIMVFDSDPNSPWGGVEVCDVVVYPDGRILLSTTGPANASGYLDAWLHRFKENGTRDPDFSGPDGKMRIDWGGLGVSCAEIALRPDDGKIVVAAVNRPAPFAKLRFAFARVLPNGALDQTFDADENDDGKRLVTVTERDIQLPHDVRDIALQGDKIVVVGAAFLEEPEPGYGAPPSGYVARFTAAGRPDTAFRPRGGTSTGGWLLVPSTTDYLNDVEVAPPTVAHPYEKLVVVGGEAALVVGRLRENDAGTAWIWDPSFSGDGIARRPQPAMPIAIAADDAGGVVAAGYDHEASSSVLWRFHANGALDSDYGGNGTVSLSQQCGYNVGNPGAACLQPVGIHALSGRRVLVAGQGFECPGLGCPTFATPPEHLPSRFAAVRVVADPLPALYAETGEYGYDPGYVMEADGEYVVRVRLTSPSADTVTVAYETVPGTAAEATAPRDYVHRAGTLTFQPGQVQKTVTITIKNDNKYEGPATVAAYEAGQEDRGSEMRTFTFRLVRSSATGATVPVTDTTLGIVDDEAPPTVHFGPPETHHVSVSESQASVAVPVRLSRASSRSFWVDVDTFSAGDPCLAQATSGVDFVALAGAARRVNFPAGDTTGSVSISITSDGLDEYWEQFEVHAAATSMGHTEDSNGSGIVTIMDDDGDEPGSCS